MQFRICEKRTIRVVGVNAYFDPQHIYYYIAPATSRPAPAGLWRKLKTSRQPGAW